MVSCFRRQDFYTSELGNIRHSCANARVLSACIKTYTFLSLARIKPALNLITPMVKSFASTENNKLADIKL